MRRFVLGTVATAITFAIVAYILPAIDFGDDVQSLLIVSVIAGLVNGFIKPIVKALALPLTVMTLGLIGIVINAGLLLLVALISDNLGIPFTVGGFPPDFTADTAIAALIGAVAISIVGTFVNMVVPD